MRTKNTYPKWIAGSLLLLAAFFSSCSEDAVDEMKQPEHDANTITFEVGIDNASLTTRAANEYGDVLTDYVTNVYVFSKGKMESTLKETGSAYDGYTLESQEELTTSLFTYETTTDKDYLFIFIACEDDYDEKCVVKSGENISGMIQLNDLETGDNYTSCCIPIFSNDESYSKPLKPHEKEDNAFDDFMIYGASHVVNGQIDGNYQPEKIVLTRQLGAVTFKAAVSTEQVTCNIVSDYYRLYLSQIAEKNSENFSSYSYINDLASVVFKNPQMQKVFPNGGNGEYTMYVPCTTTHTPADFKDVNDYWDERANYYRNSDVNVDSYNISSTSITVNGETYSLELDKYRFPVFQNCRTILTVGDGSNITVSFGTEGGINLEDQWNGWK